MPVDLTRMRCALPRDAQRANEADTLPDRGVSADRNGPRPMHKTVACSSSPDASSDFVMLRSQCCVEARRLTVKRTRSAERSARNHLRAAHRRDGKVWGRRNLPIVAHHAPVLAMNGPPPVSMASRKLAPTGPVGHGRRRSGHGSRLYLLDAARRREVRSDDRKCARLAKGLPRSADRLSATTTDRTQLAMTTCNLQRAMSASVRHSPLMPG